MKALAPIIALIIFSFAVFAQECTLPIDDLHVRRDVNLCKGSYVVEKGITIDSDNILFNCNGAALQGNGLGYGILLKERKGVRILDCNLSRFEAAIYLESSNGNFIQSNQISKGRFGIVQFGSANNTINGNSFAEIDREDTIEVPFSLFEDDPEEQEVKREIRPTEAAVFEKAIRLKNPGLDNSSVAKEFDLIFNRYFNFTHDNIEFRKVYFHNSTDDTTRIVLRIIPKKPLQNVTIFEQIPKCMAEFVGEIAFIQENYEVLEADPLIIWHFDTLTKDELISYTVYNKVDDICKQLMLTFGIAHGFLPEQKKEEQPKQFNVLMAALIGSFILMLLVVYFVWKR